MVREKIKQQPPSKLFTKPHLMQGVKIALGIAQRVEHQTAAAVRHVRVAAVIKVAFFGGGVGDGVRRQTGQPLQSAVACLIKFGGPQTPVG